ncbi:MAG: tRNA guanosine(34) transglycosylase Tgt [Candidatus Pacebacteria bacterium]|nr:tRNA guanosine(34) transglycosylase Tgt [Candidatus Paceibacterota bacterium]
MSFSIKNKIGRVRTGVIKTAHGDIETPNFAFVATHGVIKALDKKDYLAASPELTISNTFHLFVTSKWKQIKKAGGLHKMFGAKNPIMTDSGGFQVFSLGWGKVHKIGKVNSENSLSTSNVNSTKNPVRITNNGVVFNYDGKKYELTPAKSISLQKDIGADIIFAFDECTSPLHDYEYNKRALKRTHDWAKKCLKVKRGKEQLLFGIVQGGVFEDLRKESSKAIGSLPFDGFGIGGSFGEKQMGKVIGWSLSGLPEDRPRHLLGIGRVKDIFIGVKNGIDTFDCVIPTREARHGCVFSRDGRLDIKRGVFAKDKKVIERSCLCQMCAGGIKRKDLNRLFKENKPEAQRLATLHNIYFYKTLFAKIREAINSGKKSALEKVEKEYKKV